MRGELAVRLSPANADLEIALQHFLESNLPGAREAFEKTLAAVPDESPARDWLRRQIALVDFESAFATGDWTPVPTELDLWRVVAGQWSNGADGSLVLTGDGAGPAFATFRGRTGVNLEFRGEFEAANSGEGSPDLEVRRLTEPPAAEER